jgi:hypothetical protein
MAKKAQKEVPPLTLEQLRNEEISTAFNQITKDGLEMLTPFESLKYRTVVTIDHNDNERYPNLVKESISYFWNLTLTTGKTGNLVIYYTFNTEAVSKFGTVIFNRMLRSIFKHTMSGSNNISIEDCIRISTDTKDLHNFFYKRIVDGETPTVSITALDHLAV